MDKELPDITKSEIKEVPGEELVALLIEELGKEGNADKILDESLKIARNISDDSERSSALSNVAWAMAENEQEKRALEIARNISDDYDYIRHEALSRVVKSMARNGQKKRARKILNEELRKAKDRKREFQALKDLATPMAEIGEVERALEIWRNVGMTLAAGPLSAVAKGMAKNGEKKRARKKIDEALKKARKHSDKTLKSAQLICVAEAMTENGQKSRAKKILNEALRVARNISKDSSRAIVLKDIVRTMAKNGQEKRALEIARKISRDISRDLNSTSAFSEVARAMAKRGEEKRARKIFDEALRIARNISKDSSRAIALSAVARGMAEKGQVSIFSNFIENLEKIEEMELFHYADIDTRLRKLAKELIQERDEKRIKQIASSISERIDIAEKGQELLKKYDDINRKFILGDLSTEFEELKKSIEKEDLKSIEGKLDRLENRLDKKVQKAKPEIKIELKSKSPIEQNTWTPLPISIKNEGKEAAENLKFDVNGNVDHFGLDEMQLLGPKEEKQKEIRVQSSDKGVVPFEIDLSYEESVTDEKYSKRFHPELVVGEDRKKTRKETKREKSEIDRVSEVKDEAFTPEDYEDGEEIFDKICEIEEKEEMFSGEIRFKSKDIESLIEEGKVEEAGKLLNEKREALHKFKELSKEAEELKERKKELSTRLAQGEIGERAFDDAKQSIDESLHEVTGELEELRGKFVYEDYDVKPF